MPEAFGTGDICAVMAWMLVSCRQNKGLGLGLGLGSEKKKGHDDKVASLSFTLVLVVASMTCL